MAKELWLGAQLVGVLSVHQKVAGLISGQGIYLGYGFGLWSELKKMELSYDPVLPLLGIYPEGTENTNSKEYMNLYVHWSIIYNNPDMEASLVLIKRWSDKVMVLINGQLLSHKKEWNLIIGNSIDRLRGYYVKWNKSDKEKNSIWFHFIVESKEQNE